MRLGGQVDTAWGHLNPTGKPRQPAAERTAPHQLDVQNASMRTVEVAADRGRSDGVRALGAGGVVLLHQLAEARNQFFSILNGVGPGIVASDE